jgi:hypothetical protein
MTSLAPPPARQRASRASGILQVAIKPRLSPANPVLILVVVNPRPGMQKTEEGMLRRSDDNPHVPPPHHQIPRLRPRDALKSLHPVVEIVGRRIRIRKARTSIHRMHQMRAVPLCGSRRFRVQRGRNHRAPIGRTQRLSALPPSSARRIHGGSQKHRSRPCSGSLRSKNLRFRTLPHTCRRPETSLVVAPSNSPRIQVRTRAPGRPAARACPERVGRRRINAPLPLP